MTASSDGARVRALLAEHRLPDEYALAVSRFHVPLAAALAERRDVTGATLCVGLCGAQGSGKSTLVAFLQALLSDRHGLSAAVLSLDDLYLPRAARERLAQEVHPLLRTRGVPGTHEVTLGTSLLRDLAQAGPDTITPIPRFDKASDDRAPASRWTRQRGRPDLILLEGWCVGVGPQPGDLLAEPVNALEREHDADGRWREYVNAQLAGPYRDLFARLDTLVLLQAPGFECVYAWRRLQESRLREALADGRISGTRAMTDEQIERFIMHYERLTRHALDTLPEVADAVLRLDADHRIVSLKLN